MKRSTVFFDRLGVLIVGLAVLAVGVFAAAWQLDRLPFELTSVDASAVVEVSERSWWPWALLGAGVLVILLSLWSLIRRVPTGRTRRIALPASATPGGSVSLDLRPVATRAAEAASHVSGVRSARAKLRAEKTGASRSTPVITVVVVTEKSVDPSTVVDRVTEVRNQVAGVIGDATDADARVGVRVLVSGS